MPDLPPLRVLKAARVLAPNAPAAPARSSPGPTGPAPRPWYRRPATCAELLYKLLLASSAALAVWRGLLG